MADTLYPWPDYADIRPDQNTPQYNPTLMQNGYKADAVSNNTSYSNSQLITKYTWIVSAPGWPNLSSWATGTWVVSLRVRSTEPSPSGPAPQIAMLSSQGGIMEGPYNYTSSTGTISGSFSTCTWTWTNRSWSVTPQKDYRVGFRILMEDTSGLYQQEWENDHADSYVTTPLTSDPTPSGTVWLGGGSVPANGSLSIVPPPNQEWVLTNVGGSASTWTGTAPNQTPDIDVEMVQNPVTGGASGPAAVAVNENPWSFQNLRVFMTTDHYVRLLDRTTSSGQYMSWSAFRIR